MFIFRLHDLCEKECIRSHTLSRSLKLKKIILIYAKHEIGEEGAWGGGVIVGKHYHTIEVQEV